MGVGFRFDSEVYVVIKLVEDNGTAVATHELGVVGCERHGVSAVLIDDTAYIVVRRMGEHDVAIQRVWREDRHAARRVAFDD